MKRIAVVILNWNGRSMLQRFLPSVVAQSSVADIVVADNGSTDDSLAFLQQYYPQVKLIPLDRNYGFAEGYNRAIDALPGNYEYYILLNSDVEVPEVWLDPLLAYLDAHSDVAAVQPKIRSWIRRTHFEHAGAAGGYLSKLYFPYCRGRILWHVEEDKGQYDTEAEVDWTSGACMCVRTKVYKECGGLDAAFFAHMEEIDLCWRIRNAGWRLVCLPQSVVYHLGGGALSYESPRKTYLNHRNNLLMIYKNKQHPCGVLFIRGLLDYAAACFYLLQGRWGAFKAVFQARKDYKKMRKAY